MDSELERKPSQEQVMDCLSFIGKRISPEDWQAFQKVLVGSSEEGGDEIPDNGLLELRGTAMDAATVRAHRTTPELAHIVIANDGSEPLHTPPRGSSRMGPNR
jgi:hypothetical protein